MLSGLGWDGCGSFLAVPRFHLQQEVEETPRWNMQHRDWKSSHTGFYTSRRRPIQVVLHHPSVVVKYHGDRSCWLVTGVEVADEPAGLRCYVY